MHPNCGPAPEEWEDPIVAAVRRTREQILAEFNYDVRAYAAHIMSVQNEEKQRGVQYASPPPRRPVGWEPAEGK
jgi:hypothetical protein